VVVVVVVLVVVVVAAAAATVRFSFLYTSIFKQEFGRVLSPGM
jgi:hypothetical protein